MQSVFHSAADPVINNIQMALAARPNAEHSFSSSYKRVTAYKKIALSLEVQNSCNPLEHASFTFKYQ